MQKQWLLPISLIVTIPIATAIGLHIPLMMEYPDNTLKAAGILLLDQSGWAVSPAPSYGPSPTSRTSTGPGNETTPISTSLTGPRSTGTLRPGSCSHQSP